MGLESSKVLISSHTDNADSAIHNLEKLIKLSDRMSLMSTKEMMNLSPLVHTYIGPDTTLKKIIDRQTEIAELIEKKVLEVRHAHTEKIRKEAIVLAHFNDRDGDDIKFTMNKGVCKVFINGEEKHVRVLTAIPPILEFDYISGSNSWTWKVNFDSRDCVGKSPRKLFTKTLKTILENDSIIVCD